MLDRLHIEMMPDIVGDDDEIRRLHPREIAEAPRIDLNDLAGVLDLHARVNQRRDLDVAEPIRGRERRERDGEDDDRRRGRRVRT